MHRSNPHLCSTPDQSPRKGTTARVRLGLLALPAWGLAACGSNPDTSTAAAPSPAPAPPPAPAPAVPLAWSGAQLLETSTNEAVDPQVAMNASGQAVCVWRQRDGASFNIWAAMYSASGVWSTPSLIDSASGVADQPMVGIDDSGAAIAVWYQNDGVRYQITSARYTASGGWSAAQSIDTGFGDSYRPRIAMNAAGQAVVAWFSSNGVDPTRVYANRYVPGVGWGGAAVLANTTETEHVIVAMNNAGYTYVMWIESPNLIESHSDAATALWSSPVTVSGIASGASGRIENIIAKVDASNQARAVFTSRTNPSVDIRYCYSLPASPWAVSDPLDTLTGDFNTNRDALRPDFALAADGGMHVAWEQTDGAASQIYLRSFNPATGWGAVQVMSSNSASGAYGAKLTIDAAGAVSLIYTDFAAGFGSPAQWVRRLESGASTWFAAQALNTNSSAQDSLQRVAFNPSGQILVVWHGFDGVRTNIYFNAYR